MMNTVKRILMVGSAATLMLGLASCASNGPATDDPDAGTTQSEENESTTESEDSDDTGSAEEGAETGLFEASADGFRIAFPAEPVVEDMSDFSEELTITGNSYLVELANDHAIIVGATHYEFSDPDTIWDERSGLEGAVNGMVGNIGGEIITTANDQEFLGYPSAETTFAVSESGLDLEGRSQMIMRGQSLYNILAIGGTQEEFDALVASFEFID